LVDPAKSVQFDRVQWAIVHQVLIAEQGFVHIRYVSGLLANASSLESLGKARTG
jgi:hypothetical protein